MTTVTDARTGAETDLALLLTQLQEQTRTGTLKLQGRDGQVKYVYLKRGSIELLKTSRSRTLLGKALLKRRKLTDEQLRAALDRQRASPNKLRLGEILVGMGIVLEQDVHNALAYQIAEEIFELFAWGQIRSEFYRGEPPLDIFESEDLQARVSLSPVQLTREAIRRQNELVEIKRTLPSLRDVFKPTPQAYEKPEAEQNPAVQEVLAALDGVRSLSEVLDVVRAPDLVALRVLVKMVGDGDVVALPAATLVELGEALEARAEFDRARERYLRAEELGHVDFELPRKIGQLAEALGDKADACRRYVAYADLCAQSDYPDVAALTLARVLELSPTDTDARERLAELLARSARRLAEANDPTAAQKSAEAAGQYELLLQSVTAPSEQRRILTSLAALVPERDDLRERMAEVSLALGDPGQAVQDLQDLAIHALEQGNLERATTTLKKILEIDPDDLLALQSLASTYARMGQKAEAVREFLRLARTLEDAGLAAASPDRMVEIYEKVIELDPQNTQARQVLARAYDDKKENDKAAANYASMVESLRRKGDEKELLAALDKLVALKPGDTALALERARLLVKAGRGGEALDGLRALAEQATKQGDAATAQAAWTEVLAQVPGDLEAHLATARLEEKNKDLAQAGRRYAAVFELALVAGRADLAEEAVKRALELEVDPAPEQRERLARLHVLKGRKDEAARSLVRAARRARDDENVGLAQTWAKRALELDATCDDARDLLEALKRRPAAAPEAAPVQAALVAPTSFGGSVMPSMAMAEGGGSISPTITGGSAATIEGFRSKTKKIGGIADKLARAKGLGGAPSAPVPPAPGEGEAGGATPPISKGPEAPGDAADVIVSKKASSAMNKLRALKGGGGAPAGDASSEASAPPIPADAPISKGPEAPGEAVDGGLAKKASSAMNKLKALKGGGSPPSDAANQALPPPAAAGEQKVSKGPEAPGDAVDEGLAKKASSAMNRLKALKSGGGSPPSDAAAPALPQGEQKVSKGPEAPGEAVDQGLSKKASSAMDRLKALKGGGGAPEAAPAPASDKPISKGPEAPGEAVDQGLAKKASSAMDRLKALKAGGGAPTPEAAPAVDKPVSKGPEAPGEAVDQGLAKKASSAMDRLKKLKGGGASAPAGDAAPAPAPDQKISKGPEAPGEAVDQGLAKKASSAMSRLKALKAGGGGAPPPPPAPDGKPAATAQNGGDASDESIESTVGSGEGA